MTFLGGGKVTTPPDVDAQMHVDVDGSDTKGEAGRYIEYKTFGGKVSFSHDPAQDDSQVRTFGLLRKFLAHELIQSLARHPLPY